MKMNLLYLVFLIIFYFCPTCFSQSCHIETGRLGVIADSLYGRGTENRCWKVKVPHDLLARLDIKKIDFQGHPCYDIYLTITVVGTNGQKESYKFCSGDSYGEPIISFGEVDIYYAYDGRGHYKDSSLELYYSIENLICIQENHFRCTKNSCIHGHLVCNGVKDCENGADEVGCKKGITDVIGMDTSLKNAINRLKAQRSTSFGWNKNTHRAITALYLSKAAFFRGNNLEEELIAKQLELQTATALLRNSSDPITVSDLSMFVNALTVTCHNPRQFYGFDLMKILAQQISTQLLFQATQLPSPIPSAYLTLCNSNWTISESDIENLLNLLHKYSEYSFHLDVKAMAVMALTCIRNKSRDFRNIANASDVYDAALEGFISAQRTDGSFGNVYTTALVTQALISSGQESNKMWNMTSTARYLMKQLNSSSSDFLSLYLTLPVFSGTTLVDIGNVNCSNSTRKQEDDEVEDVRNKFGGKMRIQYSLYVGDQKDVIHTMYLRMPENSSAYDVMRVAQEVDSKYKFRHVDVSNNVYVYEIAGITNDPEAGKFWLLYTAKDNKDGWHYTESPDEITLEDSEHLIMWYRTAYI